MARRWLSVHGMLRPLTAALVGSIIVLAGVFVMLQSFGDQLDRELDAEVTRVERTFERDLDRLEASRATLDRPPRR